MKDLRPTQIKEAWTLLFVLGVIMINYPFIHIFNKETTVFGSPLLVVYFMVGWPLSILVVYIFVRHLEHQPTEDEGKDSEE